MQRPTATGCTPTPRATTCAPRWRDFHGVDLDNIVIGEGIDGLLGLAVKLVVEPGSTVVTSDGTYPTFNFHVAGGGGRLVRVPYRDDRQDLDALLAAALREDARMLYVCNPDNPMGSFCGADALQRAHRALTGGVLLCLDEAYCDTAPAGRAAARRRRQSAGAALPHLLEGTWSGRRTHRLRHRRRRASSAPSTKIRNHFGVNRIGQAARSPHSRTSEYLADVLARVARARDRIAEIARANGLEPLRRPPTSSPSIAGATATSPSACSKG